MADPLVYEARRTRLLFVALVVGLGLIAIVVQGDGATEAEPRATPRPAAQPEHQVAAAPASTTTTTLAARLEAPATLLVSAEGTSTTAAPPTTAPPTTQPSRIAAPPVTEPPVTAPPTTAPPSNVQTGTATWYEGGSASGCAHLSLPMGTVVTVTAVSSGRQVTCTVDDRGPFGSHIIDLSPSGFQALAPLSAGVISVRVTW